MPAFVAHSLFGADVLDALPPQIKRLVQQYSAAYEWGLQGPDILFYHIPRPSDGGGRLNRLGIRLHREKTDELWNLLIRYLRTIQNQADFNQSLAYVLGFCCHYALDSSAHPYIFYLQHQVEQELPLKKHRGLHNRLESDIDTDIHYLKTKRNIRYFHTHRCLRDDLGARDAVARMYRSLLRDLFEENTRVGVLLRCFDDALLETSLIMGHTAPLLTAYAVDAAFGNRTALNAHIRRPVLTSDVLNLRHAPWGNLETGQTYEASYPELEARALCTAAELQQRVWNAVQNNALERFCELPRFDFGCPKSLEE